MKRGRWVVLGLTVLLYLTLFSFRASAEVVGPRESTARVPGTLGLDLGFSISDGAASLSNAVAGATDTSGQQLELLGLVSFETPRWLVEAGGGWISSSLAGHATPSSGQGVTDYDLSTRAAVAEVSPQYRLTDHLQLGPLAELLFGADVSFLPGFGDPTQTLAWMGGAQALYAFNLGLVDLRAGARYLSSLSLSDRRLQAIQATLQVALPVF